LNHLSLQPGYRKRCKGNQGRGQAPWCERCESFEGRWRRGKLREFSTRLSVLLNQSSLTDLLNHLCLQSGYRKRRKGNRRRGQAPWCERCEGFEGRWRRGKLRELSTSMSVFLNQPILTDLLNHLCLQSGYRKRRKGNGGRGQAPWCERCEGFKGQRRRGKLREFSTSMSVFLNQSSLTDLLNHHFLQSAIRVSQMLQRKWKTRSSDRKVFQKTMALREAL
jgi:hypothetical protein